MARRWVGDGALTDLFKDSSFCQLQYYICFQLNINLKLAIAVYYMSVYAYIIVFDLHHNLMRDGKKPDIISVPKTDPKKLNNLLKVIIFD